MFTTIEIMKENIIPAAQKPVLQLHLNSADLHLGILQVVLLAEAAHDFWSWFEENQTRVVGLF